MRAGGCTVQQTLTAEAAGVVKHAVALARQRGHAQVTPLHVAATLLAPGGGASLLRRACLKSHPHSTSHPLQCRALELCFKVALNRLPTTAGPLVQGQPSLSNALVAALKRAQAHQRRGCLEQQQQPLLAVKVEMEQLIISILDDPSVSRVMREAGFSSTFVKNNLEETTSAVTFASAFDHQDVSVVSRSAAKIKGFMADAAEMGGAVLYAANNARINFFDSPAAFKRSLVKNEDVESVLEVLLRKNTRRINSVIVGDCFLTTENVAREVMIRIERGLDFAHTLRGVQFVTPQFSDLRRLSRELVKHRILELRRSVNNCLSGGSPVIIYAGDLKWAVDVPEDDDNNNNNSDDDSRKGANNYYCPVEHVTKELEQILASHAEGRRIWLMATANYQTYMRCRMRQPSLETLWGLQAVAVPSGGLALTLQASSTSQGESKAYNALSSDFSVPNPHNLLWPLPPLKPVNSNDEFMDKLNCCAECSAKFEAEAESVRQQEHRLQSTDRSLPFWLQQCRNDRAMDATAVQVEAKLRELRRTWNQICRSKHSRIFDQRPAGMLNIPRSPWWCASQSHAFGASRNQAWSVVLNAPPSEELPPPPPPPPLPALSHHKFSFSWSSSTPENIGDSSVERTATVQDSTRFDVKTTLALGLTDANFEDNAEDQSCNARKNMRVFDAESLKEFSEWLAEKVPWQSEGDVSRAVASAVLQCRSGMVRRETSMNAKGDVWLLALGPDGMGKRKMAQALAQIVFGSENKLVCLGRIQEDDIAANPSLSSFSYRGKTYLDRLTQAISLNPHSVVLLEEIEQADGVFMSAIMKAMERGKLADSNGREASLSDTIVFITSSVGSKQSTASFDQDKLSKITAGPSRGFKLTVVEEKQVRHEDKLGHHPCKRKADQWRVEYKETEKTRKRKSPALDLNVAGEDVQEFHDAGSVTGNSDVTQETAAQTLDGRNDQILRCARECFSPQFFKSLDKCIVFGSFDFAHLAESKLNHSYARATNGRGSLRVESSVLERIVSCCWESDPFNGRKTFEKWVEEIFEVGLIQMLSMHTITAESIVKLTATDSNIGDCFYANTSLPARLEVDPGDHS